MSGCYDLLHSGHVEFFKQAAEYGDLYVGLGSDATILGYKHHKPMFPESERLFMAAHPEGIGVKLEENRFVVEWYSNQ